MKKVVGYYLFAFLFISSIFFISCSSTKDAGKGSTDTKTVGNMDEIFEDMALGPDKKDTNLYMLKIKYPVKIVHVYKYTDSTWVQREFDDGLTDSYLRVLTYYISHKVVTLPEEEMQEMDIFIDSMEYSYVDENKEIFLSSTDVDFLNKKTPDLSAFSKLLFIEATYKYSPYGDIADIVSPKLDDKRKYIEKGKKDMPPLQYMEWTNGLSNETLMQITNISKLLLPYGRVRGDSIWYAMFYNQIDGKNYYDTAKTFISQYKFGDFHLTGIMNNMKTSDATGLFKGIKEPVKILDSKGKGVYNMKFNIGGLLSYAMGKYKIDLKLSANNKEFTEKIDSKHSFTLVQRYKW